MLAITILVVSRFAFCADVSSFLRVYILRVLLISDTNRRRKGSLVLGALRLARLFLLAFRQLKHAAFGIRPLSRATSATKTRASPPTRSVSLEFPLSFNDNDRRFAISAIAAFRK